LAETKNRTGLVSLALDRHQLLCAMGMPMFKFLLYL